MKNAIILSVSQSCVIPLGSFVNTLFVKISDFLSGVVRPFNAGSSHLFCAILGEARAGPATPVNPRRNPG